MGAETSPILFLPLCDLVCVDIDDQIDKGEGNDGNNHGLPLVPAVNEHSQNEKSIADHEGLHGFDQSVGIAHLPVLHLAPNVDVSDHEQQERSSEEEGGRNEQSLIELLVGVFTLLRQSFHDPQGKIAGIYEMSKTSQDIDPVNPFVGLGIFRDRCDFDLFLLFFLLLQAAVVFSTVSRLAIGT